MRPYKERSPTAVCYLAASTSFIDEQYAAMTITLNKWLIRKQMKNTEREGFSSPLRSIPLYRRTRLTFCEQMNWCHERRGFHGLLTPLLSGLSFKGGVENEHEKWNPINSITVESESSVPIKSEKREVKYNFILIVLYFQKQKVNEWLYLCTRSDTTENNKFFTEHEYRQSVLCLC